jgi:hypothetical protein
MFFYHWWLVLSSGAECKIKWSLTLVYFLGENHCNLIVKTNSFFLLNIQIVILLFYISSLALHVLVTATSFVQIVFLWLGENNKANDHR